MPLRTAFLSLIVALVALPALAAGDSPQLVRGKHLVLTLRLQ